MAPTHGSESPRANQNDTRSKLTVFTVLFLVLIVLVVIGVWINPPENIPATTTSDQPTTSAPQNSGG